MKLEEDLSLTYDVSIYCRSRIILNIGVGYDEVAKFVKIAEAGIPEAKTIEELWANNYLVTFTGEGLIAFLNKHYPEEKTESLLIDPCEEYQIDCYDMS